MAATGGKVIIVNVFDVGGSFDRIVVHCFRRHARWVECSFLMELARIFLGLRRKICSSGGLRGLARLPRKTPHAGV